MAKLDKAMYEQLSKGFVRTRTISFEMFGEVIEVELKDYLGLEEKSALLQDFLSIKDTKLDQTQAMMWTLWVILKAVTDIETPEGVSEQLDMFNKLIEVGAIENITAKLKPGLVEDLAKFLGSAIEVLSDKDKLEQFKDFAEDMIAEAEKTK